MPHMVCRATLFLGLLLWPLTPVDAAFTLPNGAVVAVTPFSVPALPVPDATTRDVSGALQEELLFALHRAGFRVVSPQRAEASPPAVPVQSADNDRPEPVEPGVVPDHTDTSGKLESYPLTDESEHRIDAAEDEPVAAENDTAANIGEGETGDAPGAPAGTGKNPLSPEEGLIEDEGVSGGESHGGKEKGSRAVAAPGSPEMTPEYIVRGRITLLRERVGTPARIGGGIRIKTEVLLHCAYTVEDALTGYVLLSDASSGTSARILSGTDDIDAVLHELTHTAMAKAAATIAASLSGTPAAPAGMADDRAAYQDSPGKRLKPRRQ